MISLEKVYDELYGMIEDLKKKVGKGGSVVTITPTLESGKKLADYSIDGTEGAIYAPPITEYSTTERAIGEWIDGSTVYMKVVSCGALPNNSTKTVQIDADIKPIKIYGIGINQSDTTTARPLPYAAGGNADIRVDTDAGYIRLITTDDWSSYDAYLFIEYTKASTRTKTTKKK